MVQGGSRSPWRVTAQTPQSRPTPQGQFVQGVLVSFTADNGVAASVFVPDAQYTTDNVRAAILAKLDAMSEVQNLQG